MRIESSSRGVAVNGDKNESMAGVSAGPRFDVALTGRLGSGAVTVIPRDRVVGQSVAVESHA